MQNVSGSSWLVKPTEAYITKEASESSAGPRAGTQIELNSWDDFYSYVIKDPVVVAAKDLQSIPGKRRPKARVLKGYSLVRYEDKHRKKSHIIDIWGIGVDLDSSTLTSDGLIAALQSLGVACFWHTTLSHGLDGKPRYRIIFPLAEPCVASRITHWEFTRDKITTRLKLLGASRDEQAKDPSRFWYWPACVDRADYRYGVVDGELLPLSEPPALYNDEEIPPTERPPVSTIQPKENPRSHVGFSGPVNSGKYTLDWVHKQCAGYLLIPSGARADWIGRNVYTWGGLYASRSFIDELSKWSILETIHSYVMRNSSRTAKQEMKFIRDTFEKGELKPLEKRAKVEARIEKAPRKAEKSTIAIVHSGKEIVLQKTREGRVRRTVDNYAVMLDAYFQDTIFFDELAHAIVVKEDGEYRPFKEKIDRVKANRWITQTGGDYEWPDVPIQEFRPLVEAIATRPGKIVNHERERLSAASIEGAIAAEDVATEILCAEDTPANRAAITYMLFSFVARLTSSTPTDVQGTLVMKGHGNFGKTTFLSILAGERRYILHTGALHMDARLFNKLSQRGLVELGEGVALERSNIEETKALLTSQIDVVDQKNQIDPVEAIRRWIGVVSCNEWPEMLDRRFLPVHVGIVREKSDIIEGEARFPLQRWQEARQATLALVYRRIQEGFRWQDILSRNNKDLRAVRELYSEEPTHVGGVRQAVAKLVADGKVAPSTDEVMEQMGFALRDYKIEKKGIIKALQYSGFTPGSDRRGGVVRWGWKLVKAPTITPL